MLAEVPESTEKVWLGSDDEDLKRLLRDLQQVDLPEQPLKAWGRLQLLHRIKNCINAIELDHIKVLKRIEKGDPYGVANAADWLAQSMHMRPNAAYAKVCTACELEEFPALDQAVHAGEVSPEATTVILQTLRRVRRHLSDEDAVGVESEMLLAAREMDHAQLRAHGSKLFHLLDRQAHNEVLREERERRFFDLKRRVDGWFTCSGELDPEGGTFLQTALRAIAAEDKCTLPSDDGRTPGQARADALAELAEHRLACGDLPEHGQEKPHLTIVASAETLRGEEGLTGTSDRLGDAGLRRDSKAHRLRRDRPHRDGRGPRRRGDRRAAHGAWLPHHHGGAAQGPGPAGRRLHLVRPAPEGLQASSLGRLEPGRPDRP